MEDRGKKPMKAVMPSVPPGILEWRKRTGADQWDEMWEGVLHMAPNPNCEHQDLEWSMETFLRRHLKPRRIKVFHNINLASPKGWPDDYRCPDLVIFGPERSGIDFDVYLEGATDVVVEIKSPGDESEEKLPFYAKLGVPEVWIIDRDTKEPAVLSLQGGRYERKGPGADGWVRSDFTGIDLRAGPRAKLAMRLLGDDSTLEEMPED